MHINIQIPEKSSNKVDKRSPASPVEETTILKSDQNHWDIYHIISTGFLPGFLNHQPVAFSPPPKKKRHFFGDVLHSTGGNKSSGHHRSLSYEPRELLPPPSPTPPTDLSKNSLEKKIQVRNPKPQTMEIQTNPFFQ